jgi:hypothetical protein
MVFMFDHRLRRFLSSSVVGTSGTARRFRLKANIIIIGFYAIAGKTVGLRQPSPTGMKLYDGDITVDGR